MLIDDIKKIAYPHSDNKTDNLDSYYLLRLGSLWGEELMYEYIEAIKNQPDEPKTRISLETILPAVA